MYKIPHSSTDWINIMLKSLIKKLVQQLMPINLIMLIPDKR